MKKVIINRYKPLSFKKINKIKPLLSFDKKF